MAITAPKTDKERERQWKAQNALSTMKEHARITSDPGLMRDAAALAKQEMAALAKVTKVGSKKK